jgi:acyl-CoA dehydrogenase
MTITTDTPRTTDWVGLAAEIGTELAPGVAQRDRDGAISVDGFARLRAAGITSALVPTEFGGGGATHAEMGAILRELARHDPATSLTLAMHSHLVAAQVWRHRHGMDATGVFRKVVDGPAVLLSTGAADWVGSSGSVRAVDGGFRISGRKAPTSGCEVGDIVVTSVRWDDAPDGPEIVHCAVPIGAEGVSVEHTWDTLGMRATSSHTLVFDDVFVPEAAVSLRRPADRWHPVWNTVVGAAMPLIMSAYLGVADAAVGLVDAAVAGRSDHHVVRLRGELGNAHITVADMVAAMYQASNDLTFANTDEFAAAMLSRKSVAAQAVVDTVRLAMETIGGSGYSRTSAMERLFRDAHGCLFHPLPRAKQLEFSGRVAQGLGPIG